MSKIFVLLQWLWLLAAIGCLAAGIWRVWAGNADDAWIFWFFACVSGLMSFQNRRRNKALKNTSGSSGTNS